MTAVGQSDSKKPAALGGGGAGAEGLAQAERFQHRDELFYRRRAAGDPKDDMIGGFVDHRRR
ncbi:hypothetical protein LP7551_01878 [Roseibium album]|nr:hypothetical protein LP7551_01878 [Roseibium album]